MAKRVPLTGCIFCGGRPLTAEHALGKWFRTSAGLAAPARVTKYRDDALTHEKYKPSIQREAARRLPVLQYRVDARPGGGSPPGHRRDGLGTPDDAPHGHAAPHRHVVREDMLRVRVRRHRARPAHSAGPL